MNKSTTKALVIISVGILMTGCASMFSTETQAVRITSNGNEPSNSNIMCSIQNGRGSWMAPVGESIDIRRDSRPLAVNCYDKNHTLVGANSVPSKYNTTNLWNIPLTLIPAAGIAGWVLDGTNGTANEYPATISVNINQPNNK